tara:strand:- start:2003 stop:2323 length:321 start_codon:yes stop_codon:yes gene_type:complete
MALSGQLESELPSKSALDLLSGAGLRITRSGFVRQTCPMGHEAGPDRRDACLGKNRVLETVAKKCYGFGEKGWTLVFPWRGDLLAQIAFFVLGLHGQILLRFVFAV